MSDRLSEIEGRLAAATPGPWVPGYDAGWTVDEAAYPNGREIAAMTDQEADQGRADAYLIAHAPADLAALVRFARAVKAFTYRSPNGYDPAYDEIRDLLNDLEDS